MKEFEVARQVSHTEAQESGAEEARAVDAYQPVEIQNLVHQLKDTDTLICCASDLIVLPKRARSRT